MNREIKISIVIFAFLLPFILYLGVFKLYAFNLDFYEKEFIKNSVSVEDKSKIASGLIYFLKDPKAEDSFISLFNDIEKEHLVEVRDVMQDFLLIFNVAILLSVIILYLFYYLDKNNFFMNLGKGLFYGGIASVCMGLLFIFIALNFENSFEAFHSIFFKTQWQFPPDYLLIRLFPEQFFIGMFSRIIIVSLLISAALVLIGYHSQRKGKIFKTHKRTK